MPEKKENPNSATLIDLPSFGKPPQISASDHLPPATTTPDYLAADDFTFTVPVTAGGQFSPALVTEKPKRLRLQQFLIQERKLIASGDELDGVSPGTYCLWSAGSKPGSAGRPPDRVEETCSAEWKLFRRMIRDGFVSPEKKGSRRKAAGVDRRPELSCIWQDWSCSLPELKKH